MTSPAVRAWFHAMKPGIARDLYNRDFTNKELDILRQAIFNQQYEMNMFGPKTYRAMLEDAFKRNGYTSRDVTPNANNAVGQWNYPDDKGTMSNTVGRFFYNTDKNGNVTITDTYNANGDEGITDPLRTVGLKLLQIRNNPYNINLNLGNPKDWNLKYTGNGLLNIPAR